jgi:hypothetical protein
VREWEGERDKSFSKEINLQNARTSILVTSKYDTAKLATMSPTAYPTTTMGKWPLLAKCEERDPYLLMSSLLRAGGKCYIIGSISIVQ